MYFLQIPFLKMPCFTDSLILLRFQQRYCCKINFVAHKCPSILLVEVTAMQF